MIFEIDLLSSPASCANGILRYHFGNYESVNINLMTSYNIALSNNIGSEMGTVRFGIQFPIKKQMTLI